MDNSIDNMGDGDASMDDDADDGMISVPASSLSTGDGTPPDVGDKVTFTVEGTVTATEGGNVTVKPDTVNGDPLPASTPKKSERDTLRANAGNDDTSTAY